MLKETKAKLEKFGIAVLDLHEAESIHKELAQAEAAQYGAKVRSFKLNAIPGEEGWQVDFKVSRFLLKWDVELKISNQYYESNGPKTRTGFLTTTDSEINGPFASIASMITHSVFENPIASLINRINIDESLGELRVAIIDEGTRAVTWLEGFPSV
ncbi:hypothetical protein ACFLZ1_03395 [Patescibacteria group bacterium]